MADDPRRDKPGKGAGDPLAAAEIPVAGTVLSGENPTGAEPMTEVQAVELRELCDARGEPFDGQLTQDQAADRIAALKSRDE